ncbi:MAG: enoyl-CoA hydratase/isomerase family protein [Betaproteobacteria bacterium]|nr:MAG: enoyl-CoA hydratase/isomerase family protein [Betaproteobacteria bacterium]
MTKLDDYAQKFETIRFRREEGILEMTLHTNGGSQRFGPVPHAEMEQAFLDVSRDPDNQVIILTGTGEEFSGPAVASSVGRAVPKLTPEQWMKLGSEAKRFTMNMLAIEVPMIAAVNGPALRHPEVPLMCDIVLAAEQAAFQDSAHFRGGMVPGDGVHVVFPMLMGLNRARYFLLTAQLLSAKEALAFGLLNEVLPREQLLSRAWELARQILQQPVINRRYTRVILNEYLRRPMNDLLGYGLALEGLGIVQ